MPELLVMARSTGTSHDQWDTVIFKPNNSPWGAREIDSENFRIIQIPDSGTTLNPNNEMSMVEAKSFTTAQPGFKDRHLPLGNKNLKYRARSFDVSIFSMLIRNEQQFTSFGVLPS